MQRGSALFFPCLFVALTTGALRAADSEPPAEEDVAAGHSYHGEAFNEGPRQEGQLLEGLPEIRFPTSAKNERAQSFFEQGMAQLHGFWYLEAERSFRQAAAEEPELAIAYWGMAMANVNNQERARGLIDEAMALREGRTTERERLYIEALDRFVVPNAEDAEKKDDDKAKRKEAKVKRAERFLADMEKILDSYPDDIEAKALLAVHLWMFEREGVKITSRYAVDALLSDVFDAQPMHPAHHYRIHLWDRKRPENALESAAKCGPSMPAVAHMWHMPGHIYSRLHRYADAAWQQEASARVDHEHMSRARLIPDQIHNYAHNNEWLTRNLIHVGRVEDAIEQAHNLVASPRHPQYNTMEERGSFKYGHQRLLQVLTTYGLWQRLIEEAGGPYLAKTGDRSADLDRRSWLAVAHFMGGERRQGAAMLRQLRREQLDLQDALADNEDAAEAKKLKGKIDDLKPVIARVGAAAAAVRKDVEAFQRNAKTAKLDKLLQARWLARAGDVEDAVEVAQELVKDSPGEVPPLAVLVDVLWQQGKKEDALQRFEQLRSLAADADLETPLLAQLAPVAEAAGESGDWRRQPERAADLGERPDLAQLGPFRWQSYVAPSWQAKTAEAETVDATQFEGRPRLMIFYLGFGCLHCVEQLHAFAPHVPAFREAGIETVAISTESVEDLQIGIKSFDDKLPIPLLANPEHDVFKAYRCWDDFEQQPLHGTFLIDGNGRVRWQDISYEPFTDAEFLLEEAKRLLALPPQVDEKAE